MSDKVVVTGGAGFIGSHLAKRLVKEGFEVTVFDALQLDYGRIENLKEIAQEINFIRGDIRDFNSVTQALKGAKIVFHLAAVSHLPICKSNPLTAFEVNYGGTLNVLEASRVNSLERVIFAGSDHVYGDAQYIPIDEEHPYKPKDTYSLSKAQAAELCKLYRQNYGLDTRILISGNVFGEFQDQSKVTPIFIRLALKNEPLTIDGGNQTRGFYHVGNLIDAYLLIARPANLKSQVFNVDGEEEISIRIFAEKIILMAGSRSTIFVREYRYDEHPSARLFLDKSRIIGLGYKTRIGLEEGLRRTIEWYRNNE